METLLGYISKENIEKGLKQYIENQGMFEADNMDGESSDIFF